MIHDKTDVRKQGAGFKNKNKHFQIIFYNIFPFFLYIENKKRCSNTDVGYKIIKIQKSSWGQSK